MSNSSTDTTAQFYDAYIPSLEAGDYNIKMDQTLDAAPNTFTNSQKFTVKGPQFSLPTGDISSKFPPPGLSGLYGENVCHVVMTKRVLPWERLVDGKPKGFPWVALLLFTEDELVQVSSSETLSQDDRSRVVKISSLSVAETGVVKPLVKVESDIDPSTNCSVIQVKGSVLKKVLPNSKEIPLLSHIRNVTTHGHVDLGLKNDGWFSVVTGNRFPIVDQTQTEGTKNIVHLVSLDGWDAVISATDKIDKNSIYQFVSLDAWSFHCQPDRGQTFSSLAENLANDAKGKPKDLQLKLPYAQGSDTNQEMSTYLDKGYVPLQYRTRVAESTFSWFRGPLVTQPMKIFAKDSPFLSASAATVYDKKNGLFDQSYAVAWQMGKSLALSSKVFADTLFLFRKKGHQAVGNLLALSQKTGTTDINTLISQPSAKAEFNTFLKSNAISGLSFNTVALKNAPLPDSVKTNELGLMMKLYLLLKRHVITIQEWLGYFRRILSANRSNDPAGSEVQIEKEVDALMKQSGNTATAINPTALKQFMANPDVAVNLSEMLTEELSSIGNWLADLHLLKKVPFNHLVADSRMLPAESLRFFYLDNNWQETLQDGALSLAAHSSKDVEYIKMMKGSLRQATSKALGDLYTAIPGKSVVPSSSQDNLDLTISGLLIRSALISGWPGLVVKPSQGGELLKTIRMVHLSPGVLLCLFLGVPDKVILQEPQHSLRFGVDDQGDMELRSLTGDIGAPTKETIKVRDIGSQTTGGFMRKNADGSDSNVINFLSPDGKKGLVSTLAVKLSVSDISDFGSSDLAIQMVQAPEELTLSSPTTTT